MDTTDVDPDYDEVWDNIGRDVEASNALVDKLLEVPRYTTDDLVRHSGLSYGAIKRAILIEKPAIYGKRGRSLLYDELFLTQLIKQRTPRERVVEKSSGGSYVLATEFEELQERARTVEDALEALTAEYRVFKAKTTRAIKVLLATHN